MPPRIMILNGSNLNMLGIREPHIYGKTTLAEIEARCREFGAALGAKVECHQSNIEGVLVEHFHKARETADAIVINPAGYSFTSVSLFDAMKIFEGPVIEVHISNIHARDKLHQHSILSAAASGVICGMGPYGYQLGILAALNALGKLPAHLSGVAPPSVGMKGKS